MSQGDGSHHCPGVLWGLAAFWHGGGGMQLSGATEALCCLGGMQSLVCTSNSS